jgi:hypothetical protein
MTRKLVASKVLSISRVMEKGRGKISQRMKRSKKGGIALALEHITMPCADCAGHCGCDDP